MRQISIRDTQQFKRGREFEQEFARQQLLAGASVTRCYDLNVDNKNKAPILEGPFSGLRLPDLQICYRGSTRWRECKEKTEATYTYREMRDDHGIGLLCFRDYVKIEEISGLPVDLVIGEWKTQLILIQSFERLGPPRVYEGNGMPNGEAMAFWPRSNFDVWGRYDTLPGQTDLFGKRPRTRQIHYSPERWR